MTKSLNQSCNSLPRLAVMVAILTHLSACTNQSQTQTGSVDASALVHSAKADDDRGTHESELPVAPTAPWSLIGKRSDCPEMKVFIEQLGAEPVVDKAPGYGTFLSFEPHGIEFSADTSGTITTVIIYSSLSRDYREYPGPLPRSLTWKMTRRAVVESLGAPERENLTASLDGSRMELFAEYPRKGLFVNYVARSLADKDARIIDIRIKAPE